MANQLVIKGGTVVDGTGAAGPAADVAIADGRITEIGAEPRRRRASSTPAGCVVAPGFIDIHTHYDAQVFWDPALTPSSFHGVTTVVAGNCGFSIAPTRPEHRELIARTLENVEDMDVADAGRRHPVGLRDVPRVPRLGRAPRHGLNFAAYIGHTALRLYVMGDDALRARRDRRRDRGDEPTSCARRWTPARPASPPASRITHRGADGKPVPSRFADRAEVEALFDAVGEVGRGVVLDRARRAVHARRHVRPAAAGRRARSPTALLDVAAPGTHHDGGRARTAPGAAARRRGVAAGDAAGR